MVRESGSLGPATSPPAQLKLVQKTRPRKLPKLPHKNAILEQHYYLMSLSTSV